MLKKLDALLKDKTGATAVEYAIVASVISVAALGAFLAVGQQSKDNMESVATQYQDVQ
ncbi:Flp family type IVb pilin [Qipengyuania oceanensis]|uniref:Flp family type IVb pilin n=1 Tax=Qipengyuania oceanensis TaxID=1463597 RepID=A0A844YE23_9SPHN|nr:Flp family type IVb pilin [Qipengyuania oceanensis]MXO61883.1 Flp family type IVb pilin [Qipengyuania oceanensis]